MKTNEQLLLIRIRDLKKVIDNQQHMINRRDLKIRKLEKQLKEKN